MRLLILTDVSTWAWQRKAEALAAVLSGDYDITIWPVVELGPPPAGFDLYHTFDFPNVGHLPAGARHVTGITAHVWRTWGEEQVRVWAERAEGVHANSRLLVAEMEALFSGPDAPPIWYVPNGVDEAFFHRTRPRADREHLVVGHVGKPNPRKGAYLLREACARADVEFRPVQRRWNTALSPEEIRDYYQDLHLLAVASDMDGTPNPALEAAACGVAVLSNRIGNMPEFVVDGVNGWLLVDRDIDAYVERLREAAADLDRVEAMGAAARMTIERSWTWRLQAGYYDAMWSSTTGAR